MGGYGSGRQDGRPIAEECLFVELSWMLRTGRAREGANISGILSWASRGQTTGSISYRAEMEDSDNARLVLNYTRTVRGEREDVEQVIYLTYSTPNYGGKRWYMICPYSAVKCDKLYKPYSGDRFASRKAWRLGYRSQRETARQMPFERLFKLQRKMGCEAGWGGFICRPKGMWHRTYEKHLQRFFDLDAQCSVEMMGAIGLLRGER